jgi:PIN domain nuclease of toxin-antitoxin system
LSRNACLNPREWHSKYATSLFVSSASAWEIATKFRIGKLPLGGEIVRNYSKYLARLGADEMPMSSEYALRAGAFTNDHRDPFDRMLAAQASIEEMPLVTRDVALREFDIEVLW